jgi:hypothetical protein
MKRLLLLGIVLLFYYSFAFSGNSDILGKEPNPIKTVVVIYPAPGGAPVSSDYIVKVNGRPVDIYSTPTRYFTRNNIPFVANMEQMNVEPYDGNPCYYGYFDFSGRVHIEITAAWCESIRSATIHPLSFGITPQVSGKKISFTLDRPRKVTLILNDDPHNRPIHLFANALETAPVRSAAPGVIYYGPGYHKAGTIELKDGETLYIAGGACIDGSVRVTGRHDVKICGRGVLLGNSAEIYIKSSSNVEINGIICNRSNAGWQNQTHNSSHITVRDYKIISGNIWSSDGFDPCNSQDVIIEDCFIRAGDDCIAIKGFSEKGGYDNVANPKDYQPVEHIIVRKCVFWSDNNCCMNIGTETIASRFYDIVFEDCDVLYQRDKDWAAAIGLRVRWSTMVEHLRFENIRVERCASLLSWCFPETIFGTTAGNHSWPGGVSDIVVKNVTVLRPDCTSRIWGWNAEQRVQNVTFENLVIDGKHILKPEDANMNINEFTGGIVFK